MNRHFHRVDLTQRSDLRFHNLSFIYVCVCAPVCVCAYTSLHRRKSLCVQRPKEDISSPDYHLIPLRQRLSANMYLSWQPASPRALPGSISLSAVVTGTYMTTLSFFYRVLGNQIQVLTLAQQARLPTEQSPQPFDLLF